RRCARTASLRRRVHAGTSSTPTSGRTQARSTSNCSAPAWSSGHCTDSVRRRPSGSPSGRPRRSSSSRRRSSGSLSRPSQRLQGLGVGGMRDAVRLHGARSLLADGRFRLLFLATLGSGLGNWLAVIALQVDVYDRTHSGWWVAALLIANILPAVFIGLLLGPLVDSLSRKGLMIA